MDRTKQAFRELLAQNAPHERITKLLTPLLWQEGLSVDDTGWALWTLRDQHAMLRDAEIQYRHHRRFHEWSKEYFGPDQLHWVVSDATEAGPLLDGGTRISGGPRTTSRTHTAPGSENRNVLSESHKATAIEYTSRSNLERAVKALRLGEEILSEDPAGPRMAFGG